ncbi:hypothetical protein KIW84_076543 [Lathyrus oleraceus]|uniref:Metallothionein-like protein n=1 Tax=Pisum sativum TaxID=3888 RepID=A0A9D4VYI0_PEA|nr:hypothetical protein KIW84_076543 [Pisum sativum]
MCRCSKRSSGLSYSEMETTETVILGVGPAKIQFDGAEMSVAAEDGGCKCGDSCTCNKRSSGLSYSEMETTETVILGVGPAKIQFDGAEMSVAAEDGGCKCGDSCTCDPCNCK